MLELEVDGVELNSANKALGNAEETESIAGRALTCWALADGKLEVPEPDLSWKAKLEALESSDLRRQYATTLHEMRKDQAIAMGFDIYDSITDVVEVMMGNSHTDTDEGKERLDWAWTYLHDRDKLGDGWGISKPQSYFRKEKTGLWFIPPFRAQEIWRVHPIYDADNLDVQLPTEIAKALHQAKLGKFFNSYTCLVSSTGKTAIVLDLWELKSDSDKKLAKSSGDITRCLLAIF